MYTMEDFKSGKISVWAGTKEEAERFLGACEKADLKWANGDKATSLHGWVLGDFEYSYGTRCDGISAPLFAKHTGEKMCGYTKSHYATKQRPYTSVTVAEFFEDAVEYTIKDVIDGKVQVLVHNDNQTRAVVLAANRYADKEIMKTERTLSGGFLCPACFGVVDGAWHWGLDLPEIEFPDLSLADSVRKEERRNEQIIAYYNPDGTVTCLHKKDGRVVDSKTVKRYYKDADDLRVAAKCALGKMLGEQKQDKPETLDYQPGDRALVRDDLRAGYSYGGCFFVGEIRLTTGDIHKQRNLNPGANQHQQSD